MSERRKDVWLDNAFMNLVRASITVSPKDVGRNFSNSGSDRSDLLLKCIKITKGTKKPRILKEILLRIREGIFKLLTGEIPSNTELTCLRMAGNVILLDAVEVLLANNCEIKWGRNKTSNIIEEKTILEDILTEIDALLNLKGNDFVDEASSYIRDYLEKNGS